MRNRKILKSLLIIAISLVVFIIIYLVVENLVPVIGKNVKRYTSEPVENSNLSNNEIKEILYEDKQKLIQLYPNAVIKGKVYYDVYGKKVYEDDVYLDLSNVSIDQNFVRKLMLLTNIKEVNLNNQQLTKNEKIAIQETFPNIKFKWKIDILGENVESDIETLDLSNRTITDIEDLKKSLKLLKNLKKIDFSNSNLTNEQLGNLRTEFPNIKIDWVVHLGKWSLRTDSVAFSVLIVDYNYKRMTSNDIQVLKYCTELQALDLGHQAIEDISVIGEYLPNLRVLILADNKIKDISPLANLKHLHYLELFMNNITDVTPLAACTEMVDLNISFNYRFSNIDGILNFPLLERLWLISDNISSDSYKTIRDTYPNVKLVTTGSGSTNSGWRTHSRYYAMIDMYRNNYMSDEFSKYDNK